MFNIIFQHNPKDEPEKYVLNEFLGGRSLAVLSVSLGICQTGL